MAKSPDNMTTEERLKRIRSLERKVADLEWRLNWAEGEQHSTHQWAENAWEEIRRLHVVCTQHWTEKEEYRRAAGLEPPRDPGSEAADSGDERVTTAEAGP